MTFTHQWLGTINYQSAWDLQKKLVAERVADSTLPDQLLLLEHPPTYTLGRSGKRENLIFTETQLQQENIEVYDVDRGGDITYHGPGQLVGYPILNLKRLHHTRGLPRPDLHLYLREIEEVVIQILAHFQIEGWRYKGYTGVWVTTPDGPRKIAAIGVKVSHKGITSHGFALNVNPNMSHFAGIIPCGITEHGVTSLTQQLNQPIKVLDILPTVRKAFETVFNVIPAIAPSP
jgi:lipoate-protein ligase B